jgi:hypothetical protein
MSNVPYASVVGGLMYPMVYNKLDIAHAMGVLSRYMSKLEKEQWKTIKRVLNYLGGTTSYGLGY